MRKILILAVTTLFMFSYTATQSRAQRPRKKGVSHPAAIPREPVPSIVLGAGKSTPSGVTFWDLATGPGAEATKGKVVKIRYTGWVEHGQEFASSDRAGEPTIFRLGSGQVIKGWDEGVLGMKVGGKRQLHVPAELAYGLVGMPPVVPPQSPVVFEVELIGVQ